MEPTDPALRLLLGANASCDVGLKRGEIGLGGPRPEIVDRVMALGTPAMVAGYYEIVQQVGPAFAFSHDMVAMGALLRKGLRREFDFAVEALTAVNLECPAQRFLRTARGLATAGNAVERDPIVVETDELKLVVRLAVQRVSGEASIEL